MRVIRQDLKNSQLIAMLAIVLVLTFSSLAINSCTPASFQQNMTNLTVIKIEVPINVSNETSIETITGNETSIANETVIAENLEENVSLAIDYSKISAIVEAVEGDLIQLNPKAYDPDNDKVVFYFQKPFNSKGLWQTKEGDAGKYLVGVTASDGKTNTTVYVLVNVKPSNKAPVIECPDVQYAKEGENFSLNCNIYDIEGDVITVQYEGWMNSPERFVDYDQAGNHTVVVRASDQNKTSVKTITVVVEDVNRAPVIEGVPKEIKAMEEDIVVLKPKVYDPDGDAVTVEFSKPFNEKGVWHTKIGDAGVYDVSIVASDGKAVTKKTVKVKVNMKNTAPVLKPIPPIIVNEGETVTIPVIAYDRENDPLIVSYSGWMNSSSRKTSYEDAGNYTVIVTVSDGQYSVSQEVKIIVRDVNRPPVFISPV